MDNTCPHGVKIMIGPILARWMRPHVISHLHPFTEVDGMRRCASNYWCYRAMVLKAFEEKVYAIVAQEFQY